MWISKVEDVNSNEDSVQVNNPIAKQNFLRSTVTATRRSINTVPISELTRESAAFVTFSRSSMQQSTAYVASLSSVDETLFAAD